MAQTIKLKRSSTAGKVPATSALSLGEIAINTHDGRVFFKKNDGSDSIEHIVTSNTVTTGSLELTGDLKVSGNLYLHNVDTNSTAEASALFLNGTTFEVEKRELGTAAFTATGTYLASQTIGIANDNLVEIDDTDAADNDYAKFTANGLEGRSFSEVRSDLNVEDGSTADQTKADINALDITEVGTISSGVWQGTAIASAYLDSDTAHLSGIQTFSGAKTFGADVSVAASQDLLLTDTSKIIMDSDFQIYKNIGNNSIIQEGGTGNLLLISNNELTISSGELGETFAKFEKDGSIELYEDNTKRFETTTAGVNIIGKTETDTATVTDSTQSTSKTTGALRVTGGVGIAKTLNVGEDIVAFASSDERYKDLITPIENPNEKIKLLSGNTFVWNDKHEVFKGKKDIGVIAQEVEKVLPEIVETRDNGYKAVKYEKIVALLIESNKELIKRVEDLEGSLSAEKGRD